MVDSGVSVNQTNLLDCLMLNLDGIECSKLVSKLSCVTKRLAHTPICILYRPISKFSYIFIKEETLCLQRDA